MLDALYKPELSANTYPNLFAAICLFILIPVFAIGWYQWKLIRAFKHFPSKRLDTKWILRCIKGSYPTNISLTNLVFQEVVKECKIYQDEGVCVLWFVRPHVIIFNDDFTKTFYNETAVINKGSVYDMLKGLFGNGLITSEEKRWKVHRKLLDPAFSLSVLKGKMDIFNENGVDMTEEIQAVVDEPTENLLDILKHCTFSVMAESVLGLKMSDAKCFSKIRNFMRNVDNVIAFFVERIGFFWLQWRFLLPLFQSGRQNIKSIFEIRHFTSEVIEELKTSINTSKEEEIPVVGENVRKSFARILIEKHLQDPTFTVNDVRDHVMNIMIAGYDTVAITLTWCFYLLGHHPQIQEKAYEEVQLVTPVGDVTYDDLGKLKYLDCILKETLRLYPSVPFHTRKLKRDVQCGKYTVPKGADLVFSSFLLHRNPRVYSYPEKFHPERFTESFETRPWTHISFSEGYRSCIGKKFAMMEMKVLLVHVLRRFKITALNKIDDSELDWTIVLKSTKPVPMLFTNRETHT